MDTLKRKAEEDAGPLPPTKQQHVEPPPQAVVPGAVLILLDETNSMEQQASSSAQELPVPEAAAPLAEPIKEALTVWKAAFLPNRDLLEAQQALSDFHLRSWTDAQLMEFADLVHWESCDGSERSEAAESDDEVCSELNELNQVEFVDWLWVRSQKGPELLAKLLRGVATEWGGIYNPGNIEDVPSFCEVCERWFQMNPSVERARKLAAAVVGALQWGPCDLQDFWEHASSFKGCYTSLPLQALGQLVRTAIQNDRDRGRARQIEAGYFVMKDDPDEDFEVPSNDCNAMVGFFEGLFALRGLVTVDEKRELFKEAAKELFVPDILQFLNSELPLQLSKEDKKELEKEEGAQIRYWRAQEAEEAMWCSLIDDDYNCCGQHDISNDDDRCHDYDDSDDQYDNYYEAIIRDDLSNPIFPAFFSPRGLEAPLVGGCLNIAKKGCLNQQCGKCCREGPGGACEVHLGVAAPDPYARSGAKCGVPNGVVLSSRVVLPLVGEPSRRRRQRSTGDYLRRFGGFKDPYSAYFGESEEDYAEDSEESEEKCSEDSGETEDEYFDDFGWDRCGDNEEDDGEEEDEEEEEEEEEEEDEEGGDDDEEEHDNEEDDHDDDEDYA